MPGRTSRSATRLDPGSTAVFRRRLLDWYHANRRDLPWRARGKGEPYAIWVSEIMLQQTTVQSVVPYYDQFLERYPTPSALARAPLADVLALWSGLGYYRRARHLHRAAQIIEEAYAGRFPESYEAIRALPGVGRYTAAAILSIAFDEPLAVVDGNVIRVIARLEARTGNPKSSAFQRVLWERAGQILDSAHPGDFNQAMMELGATLCTPRAPRCPECPVAASCQARASGSVEKLPESPPRKLAVAERRSIFVIERRGRILLRQRPHNSRLMAGLWELPDLKVVSSTSGRKLNSATLERRLAKELGSSVALGERLGERRHSILNRRIRLEIFRASLGRSWRAVGPWRWINRSDIAAVGTSSIVRKALELLGGTDD